MNKISLIRVFIFLHILLSGILFSNKALTLEPKAIENIDLNSLIQETQGSNSGEGMTLVWWIPQEFWQVALSQDASISPTEREQLLTILEPYFMLGVVQGEISSLGVAQFYNLEQVKQNLTLSFENERGKKTNLTPTEQISEDVELLQKMIRPILEQMMGNLGQNFHFLTFEDRTSSGKRRISPYKDGTIQVQLLGNGKITESNFAIDLPLNSLYVPRICPNGKEAHISWQYCPWDGTKLEE